MKRFLHIGLWVLLAVMSSSVYADEARIAVASNFVDVMKELAKQFEVEKGHKITLIVGSTGKHYAQIKQGAPFDAFFAADSERPERLEKEGVAKPNSRFTYAVGKLVLWSAEQGVIDAKGNVLKGKTFKRLAIANPKLAPYGKAAQHVLKQKGLWQAMQGKIVRGENIGQTFQFVQTGSAELGFVAHSQIKKHAKGSSWEVPQSLYEPIQQQAILLSQNQVAREFLHFVRNSKSQDIIREHGYRIL